MRHATPGAATGLSFRSLLRTLVRGVLFLVPIVLLVVLAREAVRLISTAVKPVAQLAPADSVLGIAVVEIAAVDILLHAVGAPVEAALAPAGEVQHGLAQGLGRDGAGMHGNAADAPAPLDDEHRLAELRRLHGGALAGRARADDDQIICVHCLSPRSVADLSPVHAAIQGHPLEAMIVMHLLHLCNACPNGPALAGNG